MMSVKTREDYVDFFSSTQLERLKENFQTGKPIGEQVPVVFLFNSQTQSQWLLASVDENDSDTFYGLSDATADEMNVQSFSLQEIFDQSGGSELVFNSKGFFTSFALDVFVQVAQEVGFLVTSTDQYRGKFEAAANLLYG